MRVLVVEDEPDLLRVVNRRLKEEGYVVDAAADGEEAMVFLSTQDYDAVVLDLMLPGVDGLTILREIRGKHSLTPVLVLTALGGVDDKVRGLDGGADDYLTKPFAFVELLARLRALIRRSNHTDSNVLQTGDLQLDTLKRIVKHGREEIELTAKEYALLEYLMRNSGQVLSRSQITEHVWGYDFGGTSNIVDVYIRYLRQKLAGNGKLIETIRGVGYRLKETTGNGS